MHIVTALRALLPLALVTFAVGCTAEAGPSPGAASSSTTKKSEITAPTLESVVPMSGALHVTWKADASCQTIEAERRAEMEDMKAYEKAFTADAEISNKMDKEATHPTKYTYRLRCRAGSVYSDYSEEVSATPAK